jgi:hypothetical protein
MKRIVLGMHRLENYKPIFPMIYLCIAAAIAMIGKLIDLEPTTLGMIVGAALTRVKIPQAKDDK